MKKIQLASQFLRVLFRSLSWFMPLMSVYLILFHFEYLLNWGMWGIPLSEIRNPHFSFIHRLVIISIELLPLAMSAMIFNNLSKLFFLYGQGILFEEENIKLIKGISIYMIMGELFQIILHPLITIALTFNNPVGERFATLAMGTNNISKLVTAFIILLASWILKEAHQIKSDQQLTI